MEEIIEAIDNKSRYQSLLKEERRAAKYIVRGYYELRNLIREESNKDAVRKIAEIKGDKKIKDLTNKDFNLLEPYLEKGAIVAIARKNLLEIKYLANAFYLFINGKTEKQALKILQSRPWKFKHEVTIRLAWMRRQKILMQSGNTKFNHPFLCNVGRLKNRRNIDREFFSVMTFISLYAIRTGQKYLFHSIPEASVPCFPRPDFKFQDAKGKFLGIEITEVNIKSNSHFEDKSLGDFTVELSRIFRKKKYHLVLYSEPKWDLVNKDISKIIEWIKTEGKNVQEILKEKDAYEIRNELYNISLRFKKDSEFYSFVYAGRQINGKEEEKKLGTSIRERIEEKLKRKIPEIRPCYLVIFIRTGIPFMNSQIVKKYAKKELDNKFKSHFDQIWAVKEQRLLRVI